MSPRSGPEVPHLLYLAWAFPPVRTAGVYRAVATANAFLAAGWRVTVVTTDEDSLLTQRGLDWTTLAMLDDRVQVRRIPFDWGLRESNLRHFPRARISVPRYAYVTWRMLGDRLTFPETPYGRWRRPLEREVLRVHREHPVSLTIATANPHVSFAGAHHLFRHARVPYVMDYRDAWRLNVYTGETALADRSAAGRLEKRYVRDAQEVWFVNPPIREWHAAQYLDDAPKMHVVENGWDPDTLAAPGSKAPSRGGKGRSFGYLGTVTHQLPLRELIEGWSLAIRQNSLPRGSTLEIGGYLGTNVAPDPELLAMINSGADAGVRYVGPVRKSEVAEFYARHDALVLALSSGRYVTSGKVYEYAATGRPVVGVYEPTTDGARVLDGHPLHVSSATLTPEGVARAFSDTVSMLDRATAADRAAAKAFAEGLTREAHLAPRVAALTAQVKR